MDSGQLFSLCNEWMKRLKYVIESWRECYTQEKPFTLIACLFAKIKRGWATFYPPYTKRLQIQPGTFPPTDSIVTFPTEKVESPKKATVNFVVHMD
jgi:hypothetical protein